jgi:uncharacterized protein YecT (DUF1311 family)
MEKTRRGVVAQRQRAVAEAYAEYEGGTLASFVGNRASIQTTKARIAELEQRLAPSERTPKYPK